jgi:hypothetical protein
MRIAVGLLLSVAVLLCNGCVVVAATVASAAAITATSVKTATKVTTATVATTGKVTAAAITSSGDVAALSMESAARLARTGMVVLVDGGSGSVVELPWREGLELYRAAQEGNLRAGFKAARIFRDGKVINAALKRATDGKLALHSGDVVELRP